MSLSQPSTQSRVKVKSFLTGLQDDICKGLENIDGEGTFQEESWERPEGGGGRSRVMREGRIFEQGGVNFSEVHGEELPPSILNQRPEAKGHKWFATGTSMVLHPRNPYIPTVHLNYRYFEAGPVWWFGGGADLTPYYPYLKDTRHFHKIHQEACDSINPKLHKVFKPWCDEYFFLKHRNESRGVGGIFFDYQDGSGKLYKGQNPNGLSSIASKELGEYKLSWEDLFSLAKACGNAFLPSYIPIIEKRHNQTFSDRERNFQLYRRGRYVEFNLVWDRGTIFGLQTNGRTESILMSLPPLARWEYGFKAPPESRESLLTDVFTKPQEWFTDESLEEKCRPHHAVD
ncbi:MULTISPECIES: oxygen-dependent coproporphyrinogen oxidase [Prochlorococcus]|uniref:Oxygen-dependent coproporphyrinogen-III oxidase n=1 Tax=Prochlorococcus marinus (strain SARG / CCMP1375 / SS120) TaxID=167539 RepID=HEM6_PROMA|nr:MULTISPECIES: oxygen-dependent coproporphyrinogen oxidase [Prochlorococcus]Q7V9T7.1 RecName: Full=Oxygen-dependent coproporphyrinogen-III oxidase; Short=CPO; Short=Coprogen oxidase; Short=Coproporphyrinogenase [Prochlorococcus marinus subsp. marinus str. CCMP1375]AAQ00781.1 Coproporphyrinogen oxidase III [Prochlorococcus marinus subsp. marinus str. CCMP1375]